MTRHQRQALDREAAVHAIEAARSLAIPDGATTTYTYTNYVAQPYAAATQTATVDGRWKTTTVDGFGRTTRVQTGNGSTVVSTADTQYAPCACSPLGKMSVVSQPYGPGATPVWTTYTYDGSGRTLTVTAPDGSATRYAYQGNSTTVTDPAGKWKTTTVDAYGNVILVTEPNPAGGANLATNYTYTPANQLATVSMTRGGIAQTRTFVYNGWDLVSATNPENGTVTYTYDNAHHVTNRTDALGQQTQYTYDSYGRLTEVQYFLLDHWGNLNEDTTQRVTYSYDNANQFTQNGLGRLSQVTFGGGVVDDFNDSYYYLYSYNTAGRVTSQQMAVQTLVNGWHGPQLNTWLTFTANYADNGICLRSAGPAGDEANGPGPEQSQQHGELAVQLLRDHGPAAGDDGLHQPECQTAAELYRAGRERVLRE